MPARRSGRFPLRCGLALDDAHDVTLLHDQKVLTIELHLSARPLSEQDAIAGLDIERHELAGFVTCAGTDRDDLTLHRLLLCRVGDDDATRALLFGFKPADHDTVV